VPAVFLSATNHADERRVGVGCRTLSWLLITLLWLCSIFFDELIRTCFSDPRSRWQWTVAKDTLLVALPIAVLVTFVQIGFYNSCWCRASFSPYVNLNPYSDGEWYQAQVLWGTIAPAFFAFNIALILWILFKGGSPTSVLCRSQARLQRDAIELARERGKES
jgi:hypothetical protein